MGVGITKNLDFQSKNDRSQKGTKGIVQVGGGLTTPIGKARYVMDWRALERNKYAPWGRGKLGGKPVESK